MISLGVIGAGTRATHIIATALKQDADARLGLVCDSDPNRAQNRLQDAGVDLTHTRFVDDIRTFLDVATSSAQRLHGVLIGTRCDTHAKLAQDVAQLNVPTFLEKPVGLNQAELDALRIAFAGRDDQVVVSFPLRMSPLFERARELVRRGRVGKMNQITAVNFVPYGGVYFGQWYRDAKATGGLWLQKATHDFDYICELAMAEPTGAMAMETQRVYGGELPDDLTCAGCEMAATCPESPKNIALRKDDGGMGTEDHLCAFSKSITHHDAASAMVMFDNGVHASYSQNFVSRRSAFRRGARVTGYEATLEFDWSNDTIVVTEHHGAAVETIHVDCGEDHHGGDLRLAQNFLEVIRGEDVSRTPLRLGLRSAALCLAAKVSTASRQFEPLHAEAPAPPAMPLRIHG